VRRTLAIGTALACAAALGAVAAVRGDADDGPTVYAAASLTEVLRNVSVSVRVQFAGSNQLAQQIREGAPADVFASASPLYTQALFREGLVERPLTFATNSLVLIVPRRNPARISRIDDLAGTRPVRLVVAGPQVPIGLYTRDVLKRLGLLQVLRKAVSLEPDVRGVLGKVALGEADAGFVYATDALAVVGKVVVLPLPRRAQPTVRFEVAIVSSTERFAAAQSFVGDLLGPRGRRALREAGFGLP